MDIISQSSDFLKKKKEFENQLQHILSDLDGEIDKRSKELDILRKNRAELAGNGTSSAVTINDTDAIVEPESKDEDPEQKTEEPKETPKSKPQKSKKTASAKVVEPVVPDPVVKSSDDDNFDPEEIPF
jgi:hypothetical protein